MLCPSLQGLQIQTSMFSVLEVAQKNSPGLSITLGKIF